VVHQCAASRDRLIAEFGSGRYDVLHYAGHAFFDPANPEQSGVLAAGAIPVTGADLASIANLPCLVFFNACESGRVRKLAPGRFVTGSTRKAADRKTREEHVAAAVGLAEAFLRGGVANFLGTYWPVGDAPAMTFASVFYQQILSGATIGRAVQAARRQILSSNDWPNYILYGDAEFRLKWLAES
jgi:CHAT domain-containing protein